MGVDLALCDICGEGYVLGFDGEHASDWHRIQVDDIKPILDEHWNSTNYGDFPESCGCGWSSKFETWNHHFLRVLGEMAVKAKR